MRPQLPDDPPPEVVRGTNVCATDGKPIPHLAAEAGDPFCSAQCCRNWHGVEIPVGAGGPNVGRPRTR